MNTISTHILSEFLEPGRRTNMFLFTLSEADNVRVSDKLITKLYKTAVDKSKYIDFGSIPNSKGDITKFDGYETITQSLQLLNDLKARSGISSLPELDTLNLALSNLEKYKMEFTRGFLEETELIVMIYNTTVYSLVAGINLIISTMIDYIKSPTGDIQVVMNYKKKERSYVLIESLGKFNKSCQKGELSKVFSSLINKEKFLGASAVAFTVGFIALSFGIVILVRELIFVIYDMRMSVSEYLMQQSEFLRMNADTIGKNSVNTRLDRKKVVKNQMDMAKKLETLANKISVKFEDADKNGRKELAKKMKPHELEDSFSNTMGGEQGFGGLM